MQDSGGPITHDMNSPEIYAHGLRARRRARRTSTSSGPDPTTALVHVTRDGGKTWTNVTPKDMPDLGRVSQIDASAFDAGTAYVAVKKPLLDDFAPYIFRTHDFGKTWTKIVTGIAANDYVHVVREDPTRRGLLYAGTQHGFYVSFDDGDHWQPLSLNLPDTQVSDIWVEANDDRDRDARPRLLHPRRHRAAAAVRRGGHDGGRRVSLQAGRRDPSAPAGATITYWLKKPAQKLTLEILDGSGQVVRTFDGALPDAGRAGAGGCGRRGGGAGAAAQGRRRSRRAAEPRRPRRTPADEEEGGGRGAAGRRPRRWRPALNRFTWDLAVRAGRRRSRAWCCGARRRTGRRRCRARIRCG